MSIYNTQTYKNAPHYANKIGRANCDNKYMPCSNYVSQHSFRNSVNNKSQMAQGIHSSSKNIDNFFFKWLLCLSKPIADVISPRTWPLPPRRRVVPNRGGGIMAIKVYKVVDIYFFPLYISFYLAFPSPPPKKKKKKKKTERGETNINRHKGRM